MTEERQGGKKAKTACPGFGKMFDPDDEDCQSCAGLYSDEYEDCREQTAKANAVENESTDPDEEIDDMGDEGTEPTREELEAEAYAELDEAEIEEDSLGADDMGELDEEDAGEDDEALAPEEPPATEPEDECEEEQEEESAAEAPRKKIGRRAAFISVMKTGDAYREVDVVNLIHEAAPHLKPGGTAFYVKENLAILVGIGAAAKLEDGRYQLDASLVDAD